MNCPAGRVVTIPVTMQNATKDALAVTVCCLSLSSAYALEQFSPQPLDVTSPVAQYAGGTVVTQPIQGYVAAPPHGPIEPGPAFKEWRPTS
jgi:hypothetical protein